MDNLNIISDTLFVPLIGRICCSEKYPHILHDEKALMLKDKIPSEEFNKGKQSEYAIVASASRSVQMDRYINEFIEYNKEAIIVELGCGLETTYYRLKRKPFRYYGLDLPEVIKYRKKLMGKEPFELIDGSIFDEAWFDKIRGFVKYRPILFIASGLFIYYKEEEIVDLLKKIQDKFCHPYIAFDTLSTKGAKNIPHYMKQLGHDDASTYFYVEKGTEFIKNFGEKAILIEEKSMYEAIPRKKLNLITKLTMKACDIAKITKMIYMKLK